jgi:hypothetical protein
MTNSSLTSIALLVLGSMAMRSSSYGKDYVVSIGGGIFAPFGDPDMTPDGVLDVQLLTDSPGPRTLERLAVRLSCPSPLRR